MAALLLGCSGEIEDPPSAIVTITHAHVRDDGDYLRGVIVATVTTGAKGGPVELWAGAMPDGCQKHMMFGYGTLPCDYDGWLIDLPAGTERIVLLPNETRELRWEVRSGNRTSVERSPLASCGQRITIVLVPDIDGARGGVFATTYGCVLDSLRWR